MIIFYALLLFSPCLWSVENEVLYRSPTKNVNIQALELDLSYSVFNTSSTYDIEGNKETLSGEDSFSQEEFNFLARYGYSRTLEFRAGIRYRSLLASSGGTETSNSGLESYTLGVKYSKNPYSRFSIAFDASFRSTLYDNGETFDANDLILGDSGNEITVGAHFAWRFASQNHLTAYLGYAVMPEDQSNEILYNLEYAVPYEKWSYGVGFEAVKSMEGDTYSDAPENKPNLNTGPSKLYNSINREIFEPYAFLSRAYKGWRFGVRVARVTAGVSTDEGSTFTFSAVRVGTGKSLADYKIEKFKTYDLEASITKVSPRGKFIKIDLGLSGGVEKGMKFDIYVKDLEGEQILVATGIAYETSMEWSIINITKIYRNIRLKKGFLARGILD